MDSNPRSPKGASRKRVQTEMFSTRVRVVHGDRDADRVRDRRLAPVVAAAVQDGPRRLEMGAVITAESKVILNHDLEMGITGISFMWISCPGCGNGSTAYRRTTTA